MQEAAFQVVAAGGQEQEQVRCPRCESTNTKFCYYNNYNLSQPRHFCKNCRRYWTKGGALRNIPVGGGSRKSSSSSHKRPSSSKRVPPPPDPPAPAPAPAPLPVGFTSLLASPPGQDQPSDPARLADGYWPAGWPDLAIYTPGSGFQ